MAKTAEYRLGPHEYPRGWFMIAASEEDDADIRRQHFHGAVTQLSALQREAWAAGKLGQAERQGFRHTLQATALVNEAFVRLFDGQPVSVKDRAHFVALVARQMRRILVDYGRSFRAAKAAGSHIRLSLEDVHDLGEKPDEDLLAVDDACRGQAV